MEIAQTSENNVHILELSGRFDTTTADSVLAQVLPLTSAPPAKIVVNMQNVSFIDSTGLSALVQSTKQARAQNGDLFISGLQQPVRIIFELTRLDEYFEIFHDKETALSAFEQ